MELPRKHKNILAHGVILFAVFTIPFIIGCGRDTDRQTFEMEILERLPDTWKYYAVDAVENFLYQESDRYQHSLADIIERKSPDLLEKYRLAVSTLESYRCSSESDAHNKLVKKLSELKRIQTQQSKQYEERAEELLKGIANRDLGINPEMEEKQQKIMEEKYRLSIQLIEIDMYDDYWFTLKEIAAKDDNFSISKVAILFIYLEKLPKLEVYFYKDPENYGWVSFYSMIDFLEYYVRKHVK
jgi:hypothetical protein